MKIQPVHLLLAILFFFMVSPVYCALSDDFVITVKTDNTGTSANNQFTIPTFGGSYNYSVDCDNNGSNEVVGATGNYTCTYPSAGTYTIRIKHNLFSGTGFPRVYFNNSGDKLKIISLDQWGTSHWSSFDSAFFGCANMLTPALDSPNLISVVSMSLRSMFNNATLANPDTSTWDTSQVADMDAMFYYASSANPDTINWDTSHVINMGSMFVGASSANPITSGWITTQVTKMNGMFWGATSANPDTSSWDTSQVTNMGSMFASASSANPDVSGWNTSQVTDMSNMFSGASSAIPDTSNWDTSKVTKMDVMFNGVSLANPDVSGWNTSQVTDMRWMFANTNLANPDTSNWNTSQVVNMRGMFYNTNIANPITSGWNTSKVTNMESMFGDAISANPDTGGWDTSQVTNMRFMFFRAISANPNTSNWNTSQVTDMAALFQGATFANPNTNGWNTSQVVDMAQMFYGATIANPNTSSWDISQVVTMYEIFGLDTLPTNDYDGLLVDFNSKPHQSNVPFSGGYSLYCSTAAQMARLELIGADGWTITDGGLCAPTVIDLAMTSDSGLSSSDDITNDATPELAIECSLAGNQMQLLSDNAIIATHTCLGVGLENTTSNTVLADGVHQINYQQRNAGGQYSDLSVALPVRIDTTLNAPTCTTTPANAQQGAAVTTTCTAVEENATISIANMICLPIAASASGVVSCTGVVGLRVGEVIQSNDAVMVIDVAGNANTDATTGLSINFLPEATNDSVIVNEDAGVQVFMVLDNDSDFEGDVFSIVTLTQPQNGTVINNTTSLSYQPNADYCNDGVTTDDFTYEVSGGSIATVAVRVDCVNDAPSFTMTCDIDASAYVDNTHTIARFYNFTNLSLGPDNESSQTIMQLDHFVNDPQGIISSINYSVDGFVTIDFALAEGVATIGVTIQDTGGIALGGNDTSILHEFNLIYTNLSNETDRVDKSSFEFTCESVSLDIVETP